MRKPKKTPYIPPTPEEKQAAKAAQLKEVFELGAQAAREGKTSMEYNAAFYQIRMFKRKAAESELLSQYILGHHSVTDHKPKSNEPSD